MCFCDALKAIWNVLWGVEPDEDWSYCPSVAVMIVGLNEGDTISHALESVYETYPRMELYVVDDGSSDDMAANAEEFARTHRGVTVLSRKLRGGKSSAMNMPLPMIKSEIVIVLSQLPTALGVSSPDLGVVAQAWWALSQPEAWRLSSLAYAAMPVLLIFAAIKPMTCRPS